VLDSMQRGFLAWRRDNAVQTCPPQVTQRSVTACFMKR
jgi:hypothetical protein